MSARCSPWGVSLLLAVVWISGCAEFMERLNRNQAPPPPPRYAFEVRIVSVEVAPQRPDGQPWDLDVDEGTPLQSAVCSILGIAGGAAAIETGPGALAAAASTRAACRSLLGAREGGAATPGAPDLVVEMRIGSKVVKTPVEANQFIGNFEFPFLVEPGERANGPTRVVVADADPGGGDTIASLIVGLDELPLGQPARFSKAPGLREMVLLSRRVDRRQLRQESTVEVRADQPAVETNMTVVAGQRVTLRVEGQVCTSRFLHSDVCVGPEGSGDTDLRTYNIPGARDRNHLALLGLIGQVEFTVARETTFVSETTGNLVLVVNDKDRDNNSGEFTVRALVE